ncbi:MAG: hypothetical protein HY847_01765 [Betaproteobacteria bacterium]|nr:hypothetical protein [Betaproteobacteria bacterium]
MTDSEGDRNALLRVSALLTLAAMAYIYCYSRPGDQIFHHLLFTHDLPAAAILLLIIGLLRLPAGVHFDPNRLALAIARHHLPIAGAVWLLLCLGTLQIYQNHPLSMDEYAASFQAVSFANGSLFGRVPADLVNWTVPVGFQGHFLVVSRATGEIASAYWPGFSLLLAPFVWLGIPWACNPLIVAASLLLAGQIARDVVGDEKARGWTILLSLASPAFTLNGIAFYAMPAHLLFNLIFVWLLLTPSPVRIFLAGVTGSFALVLHNPFPHLLFSLPWLAWLIFRRDAGLRNALLLALGYLPMVLLIGVGWLVSLDALRDTGQTVAESAVAPGGRSWLVQLIAGLTHPFRIPDELTAINRFGGMVKLWLWSSPFLLVLALYAAWKLPDRILKLMGASLLITLLGYFLVPVNQGHGWGDRYSHSAWGLLPVLAAAWLCHASTRDNPNRTLSPVIAQAALLSLFLVTALRAWQISSFMSQHLAQLPPYPAGKPAIIFVRGGYYGMDLVQNDPWLRKQPRIFVSHGMTEDAALAQRLLPGGCIYADRQYAWSYSIRDSGVLPPTGSTSAPEPC